MPADAPPLEHVAPLSATRPIVAVFDLDGTLTRSDCVVPFLRRLAGTPQLLGRLARRPAAIATNALRRNREGFKELGAGAAFAGRSVEEVHDVAEAFAAEVVRDNLRADVLSDLHHHQRRTHPVAIASASFEVYVRPIARALGIGHVAATELELDGDGRYTGLLQGPNCRGAEKVHRIHDWLDTHHGGRYAVELWAYGDSMGDKELLADADRPMWVGTHTVRGQQS